MTALAGALGRPVVARESAEAVGDIKAFAIDATTRRVRALVVGSGRSTRIVDWASITSFGPDAVIVAGDREPDDRDAGAVAGALDPLRKRVLTDLGNELGEVADVEVDDDGSVVSFAVGDDAVDGGRLRGIGSYAVVVAADPVEA